MNNELYSDSFNRYSSNGFFFRFREIFQRLFKKKTTETIPENIIEGEWEKQYKDVSRINFTEIFANRLTNYCLSESSVSCDDPELDAVLQRAIDKWYKWVQMSFGTGRVYLIPYTVNGKIYTDIIPQGRAWVTRTIGDDIVSIGVLADIRTIGREIYYRLTNYEWNPETRDFLIQNKAVRRGSGTEIALSTFEEWATIQPEITIRNTEKPLFAYVDCPKDNRNTDKLQGAPITFGCKSTIDEIYSCLDQYRDEYDLKQTWLGIDSIMLDKNGNQDNSKLYKTFMGKSTDNLFEIFSPDIRDASYKSRLLDLFARLEKQVGTSSGILTPAETSNATATQVRRSMYDTLSIVSRMRKSIESAVDILLYAYTVYMSLLGIPYSSEYSVNMNWSDDMTADSTEQFMQMVQAHTAKVVSDAELRLFVKPNETMEEAEAAIAQIRENQPEPIIPDYFGE